MFLRLFRLPTAVAIAVAASSIAASSIAAAGPSEPRDWLRAVKRHYQAAEENRFVPNGENPQWDFDLDTVVNDMEWRARTAAMLRGLRKPGDQVEEVQPKQLADGEEPTRLQFRF